MQPKYYGAAAQYNKSGTSGPPLSKRLIMIGAIGVGVIIFLMIVFTVIGSISKGPQDNFARLAAREANLVSLIGKQTSNIQSGDLGAINATASLLFNGDNSAINRLMTSAYGLAAIPPEIASSETPDSTIDTSLKNATLNGTFDRTYIGILQTEITSTYSAAQAIANATSGTVKATAITVMKNLLAISTQLNALKL